MVNNVTEITIVLDFMKLIFSFIFIFNNNSLIIYTIAT